jgi:general secretion pathway protein G
MGIVLVLAALAQPLVVNASKRARDAQLKRALREVRAALDGFHDDWKPNDGLLCNKAVNVCRKIGSQDGYPKQLDTLLKVEYVDTTLKLPPPPPPEEEGEKTEKQKVKTEHRVYLRNTLMTDPITGRAWQLRCYDDPPDVETWCGKDIYDIRTTSDLKGLDGTPYHTW